MKTQLVTALSIAAVLGTAGGAFAINQSVLTSASTESSVVGTASPVLVPVAPKGANLPEGYGEQPADPADPAAGSTDGAPTAVAPAQPVPASNGSTGGPTASHDDDEDDDHDSEDEDHEDEDHEDEHEDDGSDDDD